MITWAKIIVTAVFLITLTAPTNGSQGSGLGGGRVDLTKRNQEFAPTASNVNRLELKRIEIGGARSDMTSQRFPTRQITPGTSPLSQRRAPISTNQTRETPMIRPEVREFETISVPMAQQNRRMAYLRNQDRVLEKKTVSSIQNSRVTNVQDMAQRQHSGKEPSMRDLNRFSFQRNHADSTGIIRKTIESDKPGRKK